MASSSTNSPCAACKFLRRKCTTGCVFAPYFPPDQPTKFANVHRVFGASNVAKLLNDLSSSSQREDAVNSLAYEAEARLRDPVYGCVGYISILQHRLKQLQQDLDDAKKELSSYVGPFAMSNPFLPAVPQQPGPLVSLAPHPFNEQQHPAAGAVVNLPATPSSLSVVPYGMHSHAAAAAMGLGLPHAGAPPPAVLVQHQQYHPQQIMEAKRLAAAAAAAATEHQEMLLRGYDQQQHDLLRYTGGTDGGCGGSGGAASGGFSYLTGVVSVAGLPSGLALSPHPFDNSFQNAPPHPHFHEQRQQHHHQRQHHQQHHQQQTRQHDQRRLAGDEVRSGGVDDGTAGLSS